MCRRNESRETTLVNMPPELELDNLNFVYAAYLPPGLHQFLIYCPKTDRLFVKDVMVDVSHGNYFSEYPRKARVMKKRKKEAKVWSSAWRHCKACCPQQEAMSSPISSF